MENEEILTEGSKDAPSVQAFNESQAQKNIDFEKIRRDIKDLKLNPEDEQMFNRYLSTVIQHVSNPEIRALGIDCYQFINRQMNPDTFISDFNETQYANYIIPSSKALFRLVYLKYPNVDFSTAKALYTSTYAFMDLLYNRVLKGKNKKYNIDITNAKNPPRISTGGGN